MSEPKKGGRPVFVVTDKMRNNVKLLSGCGLGQDKIAVVIGCSERTLARKFKKELAQGAAALEAMVCTTFVTNLSKGGSLGQRAAEFLAHTRFGWSKYAPPPAPPKPQEKGKKELLNEAAQTGHENSSWGELLN